MRRPHLRTARLALRPLAASDEAALVAGLNDWEVARWLAVVPFPYGPEDFLAFLPPAAPGSTWVIAGPVASAWHEGNLRSAKVLRKLGFAVTGHERKRTAARPYEDTLSSRMKQTRARWLAR